VSAAANLRCHIFSLSLQSDYEVKEIAGNVIPAICSTNSIVSALEVIEAMKFISKSSKHKECYVQNDRMKKINAINPMKPNPKVIKILI
jgi:ubiquitin-like 1-activating enzyme E1 B